MTTDIFKNTFNLLVNVVHNDDAAPSNAITYEWSTDNMVFRTHICTVVVVVVVVVGGGGGGGGGS